MAKPCVIRFPKERSHTLYFLEYAKNFSTVHVDTKVDMTSIIQVRNQLVKENGMKYSYISFLAQIVANVIKNYPEANSAVKGSLFPKIAYYNAIHAKFTIDKNINGKRAVLSGLIPDINQLSLESIQDMINYYRDLPFEDIREFQPIRTLHSLPLVIGQYIYRKVINNFQKREALLGTYSITSFGHRSVEYVHPVISSTLSFGVGAIQKTPVVIDDAIVIKPMMGITLSFDHRAIDGAMASDILSDVKAGLEQYKLEGVKVWQEGQRKMSMM